MSDVTFSKLGLSSKLLSAVEALGYTNPTPIQEQAIPVALTGKDVLGIAQTGTGKTASFTLPMIDRLDRARARARMPRSLILAPTRELAAQVAEAFDKYGVNHKLNVALLIGGVSFDEQDRRLDRGADVLIATPGRMLDHFQRGKLLLTGVEMLVIDEADRMLDMGFIPDIERICRLLPTRRQTLFFSATMPPEIQRLVDQFLKDPIRIEVSKPATAAKTITQRFFYCPEGEDWAKREMLRDLIRNQQNLQNAIVFCNRKRDVAILFKSLTKHGFNAGALHGDMDQSARTATLAAFRSGKIPLLAASDVAARGLDIPEVSHVFNFDVPLSPDDYVHRIGRTGRAGREGYAATLVGPDDLKRILDIEKLIGEAPTWLGDAPGPEDFEDALSKKGRRRKRGQASSEAQSRGGRARTSARTENRKAEAGEDGVRTRRKRSARDTSARSAEPTAPQKKPEAESDAVVAPVTSGRPPPKKPSARHEPSEASAELAFAGNVPAFLQRPVRRPAKPQQQQSDS